MSCMISKLTGDKQTGIFTPSSPWLIKLLKRTGSSTDPWDTLLPAGFQLDLVLMMGTPWNSSSGSFQCISLSVQHRGLTFVYKSVVILHYFLSWDFFPSSMPFEADFQTLPPHTWLSLCASSRGRWERCCSSQCALSLGWPWFVAQAHPAMFHVCASEPLVFRLLQGWFY